MPHPSQPTISILLPTKDRPQAVAECLRSILRNTYLHYEVLVLDQSEVDQSTQSVVRGLKNKKIRYIKLYELGKSTALNRGLALAQGSIVALTDDDCVVDRQWLTEIQAFFVTHPQVSGVFGQTLPYRPESHPSFVCPATFTKAEPTITTQPQDIFYLVLGQGNNVSYRKAFVQALGGMNEQFGPGAQLPTAEDAEFIYRALGQGFGLAYAPAIRLWHNRWLTPAQEAEQQVSYTLGISASVAYGLRHRRDWQLGALWWFRWQEQVGQRLQAVGQLVLRGKLRSAWRHKVEVQLAAQHGWALIQGFGLGWLTP